MLKGLDGTTLGPGSSTGVSNVLQQVSSATLWESPPVVKCTRSAELLVIPGPTIRAAIAEAGKIGEQLTRELWCMHTVEVARREIPMLGGEFQGAQGGA